MYVPPLLIPPPPPSPLPEQAAPKAIETPNPRLNIEIRERFIIALSTAAAERRRAPYAPLKSVSARDPGSEASDRYSYGLYITR
jgi:hypothetical protein